MFLSSLLGLQCWITLISCKTEFTIIGEFLRMGFAYIYSRSSYENTRYSLLLLLQQLSACLSRVAENALFIHDKFLDVGRYRLLLQYQSSRCKPQHHACSMDFIGYQQAVDIEEYSCAKRAFRDRGWGEIKRRLLELVHNKKIVKFSSYLRFSWVFVFLEFIKYL